MSPPPADLHDGRTVSPQRRGCPSFMEREDRIEEHICNSSLSIGLGDGLTSHPAEHQRTSLRADGSHVSPDAYLISAVNAPCTEMIDKGCEIKDKGNVTRGDLYQPDLLKYNVRLGKGMCRCRTGPPKLETGKKNQHRPPDEWTRHGPGTALTVARQTSLRDWCAPGPDSLPVHRPGSRSHWMEPPSPRPAQPTITIPQYTQAGVRTHNLPDPSQTL
ncbi:hypothetical protein Bbelb_336450 [Branchiostoma belcheri]|nr:hypothetical protein Bbelb_336450 [Branchiostoma belcheri]